MRVLLDESLPRKLALEFSGHEVQTVASMGWKGTKNGALFHLIAGRFDVLVSTDQSLKHQQNLQDIPFGLVVLKARSNALEDLKPLVPQVLSSLETIRPGQLLEFGDR